MAEVGIVMGSDSDLPVMAKAAKQLEELGIEYEIRIISAHREPHELVEWAGSAEERGIKVIIAGAGMAAALPGMCAALFSLPVIGVPLSGSNLEGLDALLSTVQMPSGIPVATVAVDGTKNAAILAARILAVSDPDIAARVKKLLEEGKNGVIAKDRKLQDEGYRGYMESGK